MVISQTAGSDYSERFRDMYTFSDLIWNIRKVGKIDSRNMQGQSAFTKKRKINVDFTEKKCQINQSSTCTTMSYSAASESLVEDS